MTGIVSSTGRQFIVIADSARGPAVEIVIFATGDETQPLARFNGDDIDESAYD